MLGDDLSFEACGIVLPRGDAALRQRNDAGRELS